MPHLVDDAAAGRVYALIAVLYGAAAAAGATVAPALIAALGLREALAVAGSRTASASASSRRSASTRGWTPARRSHGTSVPDHGDARSFADAVVAEHLEQAVLRRKTCK